MTGIHQKCLLVIHIVIFLVWHLLLLLFSVLLVKLCYFSLYHRYELFDWSIQITWHKLTNHINPFFPIRFLTFYIQYLNYFVLSLVPDIGYQSESPITSHTPFINLNKTGLIDLLVSSIWATSSFLQTNWDQVVNSF